MPCSIIKWNHGITKLSQTADAGCFYHLSCSLSLTLSYSLESSSFIECRWFFFLSVSLPLLNINSIWSIWSIYSKASLLCKTFVLSSLFNLTDRMCLCLVKNTVVVKQAWLNDSYFQGQSTSSLPLRFWDQSLKQYKTLDLQCTNSENGPKTPEPVVPTVSQSPPSTTWSEAYQEPPSVFCSSHEMNVELPAGPISEVVLKGGCLPLRKIYR